MQYTDAFNIHGGVHSCCSQYSHTVQNRPKHAQIHPRAHMDLKETRTHKHTHMHTEKVLQNPSVVLSRHPGTSS